MDLMHGPASQERKLATEGHVFRFVTFANAEEDVKEIVAIDAEDGHLASALHGRRAS